MSIGDNTQENQLKIRCASCGQTFYVGHELMNRTVECGSCKHQFKIQDQVIMKTRKFYPGEKSANVDAFKRINMTEQVPAKESLASLPPVPSPLVVEPTSPQRLLLAALGVFLLVITVVILFFGSERSGVLADIPRMKLIVITSFISLLGTVFMIYGNPKARWKASAVALMLAGLVLVLTLQKEDFSQTPLNLGGGNGVELDARDLERNEAIEDQHIKLSYGLEPLLEQVAKDTSLRNGRFACGIWLKGMRDSNKLLIRDYIQRVCEASLSPHIYPRGDGNFLLVVGGSKHDYEALAKAVDGVLGRVEKVHQPFSLLELQVDNSVFDTPPIGELSNTASPKFYELNLKELQCIEVKRMRDAVKRLKSAEPKTLRIDITHRLLELMDQHWCDFKPDVCDALLVWDTDLSVAGDKVMDEITRLTNRGYLPSRSMIDLAVKAKRRDVLPYLMQLWHSSSSDWERSLLDLSEGVEDEILANFPKQEGYQKQSAIRILGSVGGSKSKEFLLSIRPQANAESRVLIDKAVEALEKKG